MTTMSSGARAVDGRRDGATVLPLGGVGTGSVGLAADGGFRQWQLHNIGNHLGALPNSLFAVRLCRWEPPFDEVRVLQRPPAEHIPSVPLVTDADVPDWQRTLLTREQGLDDVAFDSTYPMARLRYDLGELPLDMTCEAMNPFVPLDVDASSIPTAMFSFEFVNRDSFPLHGWLGGTVQNAVGWDGVTPIDGVRAPGYGGNTNRVLRHDGWTRIDLDNRTLPADCAGAGQLLYAVDDPTAPVLAQFATAEHFFAFLRSRAMVDGAARPQSGESDHQRHGPFTEIGASPAGATWNAGVAVPFVLEPGERRRIRIALCWHFPNRYVDFPQFGPPRPEWGPTRFWLGNHYATRYPDAVSVFERIRTEWDDLTQRTRNWVDTLTASELVDDERIHLAAAFTTLRTPTCFRGADGTFFGFEGLLGASTGMWSGAVGGSCPLNCTHVWNYAQAVAAAFPELEQNMRSTEFDSMQAPEGYVPHRVVVPIYLRQFRDEPIGGPDTPALDGMLGSVLKTYREFRRGAGADWLRRYWRNVQRLLEFVDRTWNVDGTGMLSGIQPSTHDIDLCGHNTYQGTLWIAALRAAEQMAVVAGDSAAAQQHRTTAALASAAYDQTLFTGEYYEQHLLPGDDPAFQWGRGCLSDQLIGQWWAHQLDLGYLFPADHVRAALASVVRYNLRRGFADFVHPYREFAVGEEAGLVVCSWPHDGRPDVPTRYADEVWTGVEYQVAAHCLWEGMTDEATQLLDAVWQRYDGRVRNPYNEIECGDHYVRSMASWSVVDALAGFTEDAQSGSWTLRWPTRAVPILASSGWGLWSPAPKGARLHCAAGSFVVEALRVTGMPAALRPIAPTRLAAGDYLLVELTG